MTDRVGEPDRLTTAFRGAYTRSSRECDPALVLSPRLARWSHYMRNCWP
jgi:hypothetical protein